MIHLVRHGRPLVDRTQPPHRWELDPAGFDDVWALRDRLPQGASWYTSPEPKAVASAQLLTDAEVGVLEGLREHVRDTTAWYDDHAAVVARALERPDDPAADGWEPVSRCRERVVGTVRGLLETHGEQADLVLVGHGTAWTVLVAALRGDQPDLERWRGLALPDVWTLDPLTGALGFGG